MKRILTLIIGLALIGPAWSADDDPITAVETADLTRWAWANAGYIYFGARDDSADSGVTIKASSVEIKP